MPGMVDPSTALTPEAVEAKMHMNPQQRVQLQRIVVAGLKVMFSEQTHKLMLQQLQGPLPIAQKIGQGVAGLVALLFQESRRSLPPNLLIPAGMILCIHAAQWLKQAGQQITDQDIGAAIEAMTRMLMHAVGIDPDKVQQMAQAGPTAFEKMRAAAPPTGLPPQAAAQPAPQAMPQPAPTAPGVPPMPAQGAA